MSYFDERRHYISMVQKILDDGGVIPYQEHTCYDEELCAKCAKALENDLGPFEDLGVDNFLAVIFGYLQYLNDHNQISPIDSEYLTQAMLACVIFASRHAAEVAGQTLADIVKAATDFGVDYTDSDKEDEDDGQE